MGQQLRTSCLRGKLRACSANLGHAGHAGACGANWASLFECFSRGGAFDGPFQVLRFDVCVDLRGVQSAMTEELLDVTNAGAATQEMRRATVAKGVDRGFDFGL
jgi:hypothetical protein